MLILSAILAALAAALHVFIFYLEVFAWEGALARKIFGPQSSDELRITTFYAYNQGVYNLALAVVAGVGAALSLTGATSVGSALILAGAGSMLVAALALGAKSPKHRSAAVKQGALPLLAVIATLIVVFS
ncbi:DUF1304 domain-containing protein [Arcanobacterium haemolyticum]|nr:DUF1304 domain-containing protein [Arcanobacterium haemolyticum]